MSRMAAVIIRRVSLLLCGLACGCATPDWARHWAVAECFSSAGVRIQGQGKRYWHVAGADENRPHPGDGTWSPAWRFPSDMSRTCIDAGGAELSQTGQLAVAWRYRRIEVYNFATGQSLAKIPCRAVAVGWSNDGTRLAYLTQPDGATVRTQEFDLKIWSLAQGETASWRVRFGSIGKPPWMYVNAFAISWDTDDRLISVSTRTIPLTPRPWQCIVIDVETGPLCDCAYADAFFVGPALLVACERVATGHPWDERVLVLLRVDGTRLVCEKQLPGRMPAAASRPEAGVYLVWQEPPWWEYWAAKGYSLEMRNVNDTQCVRDHFWAQAESVTLVRPELLSSPAGD